MTDRGRGALVRTDHSLTVGPSSMVWRDGRLTITLDEVSSLPLISRMRGTITLTPSGVTGVELPLTDDGAHIWRPFAPTCTIDVDLNDPAWQWQGHGYFDANFGARPLESDFRFWTWGRYPVRGGALCVYDAVRRDGTTLDAAFRFAPDGSAHNALAPPRTDFGKSRWGIRRETRADPGTMPREVLPMLGAPFYNRAAVTTVMHGERMTGVHEALDLDRYASPWVKALLAVRVPRRAKWSVA